jgi:hypothetical protein
MWRSIQSFTIAATPFRWLLPRYEKTVIDTVAYAGPLVMRWKNP